MMGADAQERLYAQVIARAWLDPDFKSRLLHAPKETLTEFGVDVPPGVELRVVQDTERIWHIHLPVRSAGFDQPGQ